MQKRKRKKVGPISPIRVLSRFWSDFCVCFWFAHRYFKRSMWCASNSASFKMLKHLSSNKQSGLSCKRCVRDQAFLAKYNCKDIPGNGIQPSSLGNALAFCSYCKTDFTFLHSGTFDIQRHWAKKRHKQFEAKAKWDATASEITQFMLSKIVISEEGEMELKLCSLKWLSGWICHLQQPTSFHKQWKVHFLIRK